MWKYVNINIQINIKVLNKVQNKSSVKLETPNAL